MTFELNGSVWMTVGGETFGGQHRVALLAQIAQTGSITKAAKAAGMSYKAAWDAIDAMNTLAGEPLVERVTGGKGGGGTRLTARGRQLVDNFQRIEAEHQRFVESLGRQAAGMADDYLLIRKLSMKTSARNQFVGMVNAIHKGAVNDEIELRLGGGLRLVATVTCESTASLGLTVGAEAFALVKASSVILLVDDGSARFSAQNRFPGTVSRIQAGAVNTEVVLKLAGGASVAAIVSNESVAALGLAEGAAVTAIFPASSVILAVPA